MEDANSKRLIKNLIVNNTPFVVDKDTYSLGTILKYIIEKYNKTCMPIDYDSYLKYVKFTKDDNNRIIYHSLFDRYANSYTKFSDKEYSIKYIEEQESRKFNKRVENQRFEKNNSGKYNHIRDFIRECEDDSI